MRENGTERAVLDEFLARADRLSYDDDITDYVAAATSDPDLFIFSPLLRHAKLSDRSGPALQLLEIFAYGTMTDYMQARNGLPALSQAQQEKLQILTLISLASGRTVVGYGEIQTAVGVCSVECVVIQAVHTGLLSAQLSSQDQAIHVLRPVSRELKEPVGRLLDVLGQWDVCCEGVQTDLLSTMEKLRTDERLKREQREAHEQRVDEALERVKTVRKGIGKARREDEQPPPDQRRKTKSRK